MEHFSSEKSSQKPRAVNSALHSQGKAPIPRDKIDIHALKEHQEKLPAREKSRNLPPPNPPVDWE